MERLIYKHNITMNLFNILITGLYVKPKTNTDRNTQVGYSILCLELSLLRVSIPVCVCNVAERHLINKLKLTLLGCLSLLLVLVDISRPVWETLSVHGGVEFSGCFYVVACLISLVWDIVSSLIAFFFAEILLLLRLFLFI